MSLQKPLRVYDVLKPVIHTKDEATVESEPSKIDPSATRVGQRRRSSAGERARLRTADTAESLKTYANHLLETIDLNQDVNGRAASPRTTPLSPSKVDARSKSLLSPLAAVQDSRTSRDSARSSTDKLEVPNGHVSTTKARQGSFVQGDDELVAEATEEGGCGQAVEVLSRHSTKSEFVLPPAHSEDNDQD